MGLQVVCMQGSTQTDDCTDAFKFTDLTAGDTVEVTVEACNGDLKENQTWDETLEFVGKQNLKAQSRKESYEFRGKEGRKVYLRFSAEHKNNFGFTMSQRDKSKIEFSAMRQDPIRDDRDWHVVGISN